MKKALLVLGLVGVCAGALVRWLGGGGDGGASDGDTRLVFNRLWVDRLPQGPKDTANIFAAVTGRERMGIFQSTSTWKGSYELFQHTASGDKLRVVYPHTDDKENVKVRAWTCGEDDMDYCLELSGASRGVKRYHSQDGWEIGAVRSPQELLDRVASRLPHAK